MHRLVWVQMALLAVSTVSCRSVMSDVAPAEAIQLSPAKSPTPEDIELLSRFLRVSDHPRTESDEELRRFSGHLKQVHDLLDALLPTYSGNRNSFLRACHVMVQHGILHDGMTLEAAIKVMGPPTSRRDSQVTWYHNPDNRWHVYPGLYARKEGAQLFGFVFGMM
jgi:hypothetical protein